MPQSQPQPSNTPTPLPQQMAEQPILPPAVTLPLAGQYIIEASAGTGKTWTLTGILLRLLIEGGIPCDKIIATTFTRAAAAEMRERIRSRLTIMQRVLRLCVQALGHMQPVQDNKLSFAEALERPLSQMPKLAIHELSIKSTSADNYEQFLATVAELAIQANLSEQVQGDAIHWHLVTYIAKQFFEVAVASQDSLSGSLLKSDESDNPSAEFVTLHNNSQGKDTSPTSSEPIRSKTHKPLDFRVAIQRTTIALNQLDRLFVGTLDSLCQKWLREFSAETGYTPNITINTQPENLIMDLVHDQIRAFRAWLAQQQPEIFELMMENRLLASATDYLPAINKALTFYSTPIDTLTVEPVALDQIQQVLTDFLALTPSNEDMQAFDRYLDKDYRVAQGFTGNNKLHLRFEHFFKLSSMLQEQGLSGIVAIKEDILGWLESIANCIDGQTGFKKGFDTQRDTFCQNAVVQILYRIYHAKLVLDTHIGQINQYFVQYISRTVKEQLPVILEARQQTTFSLQLARLNEALQGKQGIKLARYIRHQYPVLLVDESQDINTEQAMLIQQIYLPAQQAKTATSQTPANPQNKSPKSGFLLLVGDPKQAIYGFRGGDVSNYTAIKSQFSTPPLALTQNFRSSQAVITALNHWFGVPNSDKDNQINSPNNSQQNNTKPDVAEPYALGEQINYRYIQAFRADSALSQASMSPSNQQTKKDGETPSAVFLLAIPHQQDRQLQNKDEVNQTSQALTQRLDFATAVTAQILALLDPAQGYRYQNKPIQLSQICVLADTNRQLDVVENSLHQRGIATMRGGTQSVFADQMAQDLIVLMQAMLYPYDIANVRRLLMSHFFGLDLKTMNQLCEQSLEAVPANEKSNANQQPLTLTSLTQMLSEAGKHWLAQGFLSAIQEFLNYQFRLSAEITEEAGSTNVAQDFWQRLARLPEGERLLIDLRQLLDIISQHTKGFGEHQLLKWLELMVTEQPKTDWSMQHRLPTEDGIALMTIHQSKGLEFPIVFVVGLDKKPKNTQQKHGLYLYSQTAEPPQEGQKAAHALHHRRLSPLANIEHQDFAKEEKTANYTEKLRLAYVAFTRAKDRLYIVAQASGSDDKFVPLKQWLPNKNFDLPEHLIAMIPTVDIDSLSKYLPKSYQYQPTKSSAPIHPSQDSALDSTQQPLQRRDYEQWISAITQTKFIGWANTSFTALARQLSHDRVDLAVTEPDYDGFDYEVSVDEAKDLLADNPLLIGQQNDTTLVDTNAQLLRFRFEKGANAGTFLHKILETLPVVQRLAESQDLSLGIPAWSDETLYASEALMPLLDAESRLYIGEGSEFDNMPTSWQTVINRAVDNYQIGMQYRAYPKSSEKNTATGWLSAEYMALVAWLYNIVHTPLGASGQALAQLPNLQKIHELAFNMSLRQDFSIAMLNELFAIEGVEINLYSKAQLNHYWRYLRGEIDLVYQLGEKFFVVDYKSNYLGDSFEHYHKDALKIAMNEHGYWLQASIYQVALHRFLQLRLPDYNIRQHLGAVEYVFLRGMHPDKPNYGKLVWQPSPEFILALDMLFGKAEF